MRIRNIFKRFGWQIPLITLGLGIAGITAATGCVCLFACPYNPPWPGECKSSHGFNSCRDGLYIQLTDKHNINPEVGVKADFQIVVQPDNQDAIEIECTTESVEQANVLQPTCFFSYSSNRVSAVFVEDLTATSLSIVFKRENMTKVFSEQSISYSYSEGSVERCGRPEFTCRTASLTLEVE